jgi:hypothetical protein
MRGYVRSSWFPLFGISLAQLLPASGIHAGFIVL